MASRLPARGRRATTTAAEVQRQAEKVANAKVAIPPRSKSNDALLEEDEEMSTRPPLLKHRNSAYFDALQQLDEHRRRRAHRLDDEFVGLDVVLVLRVVVVDGDVGRVLEPRGAGAEAVARLRVDDADRAHVARRDRVEPADRQQVLVVRQEARDERVRQQSKQSN